MASDDKKEKVQELINAFFRFKRLGLKANNADKTKKSENMLLMALVHMTKAGVVDVKISDLSSKFHMTPAAATHLINSLEERKLLVRVPHQTDRRIVIVKATEKGFEKAKEIEERLFGEFEMLFDHLGEKDSVELARLLTISYDFFKEKVSECSKEECKL